MDFARITLIGRLGADPEIRFTPDGAAVCRFRVAVNTGEGDQRRTVWYRVSAWRKLADAAYQHLRKGRLVFVEGDFTPQDWIDRSGVARCSLEVTARDIIFLDRSAGETRPAGDQGATQTGTDEAPF